MAFSGILRQSCTGISKCMSLSRLPFDFNHSPSFFVAWTCSLLLDRISHVPFLLLSYLRSTTLPHGPTPNLVHFHLPELHVADKLVGNIIRRRSLYVIIWNVCCRMSGTLSFFRYFPFFNTIISYSYGCLCIQFKEYCHPHIICPTIRLWFVSSRKNANFRFLYILPVHQPITRYMATVFRVLW